MTWLRPTSLLDTIFEGSLLLKGLSGVAELTGALILIMVPGHVADSFVEIMTSWLPDGVVSQTLENWAHSLWTGQHVFAIAFLLIHASIKFIIVVGLLRNLRWAYPFSFITLAIMIAYQFDLMAQKFSIGIFLITAFDFFIMWLIWREYKKLPQREAEAFNSAKVPDDN